MTRLTTADELPPPVSALLACPDAQSVGGTSALAQTPTQTAGDTLERSLAVIARSPFRIAIWMAIVYGMSAEAIHSIRWEDASLDALHFALPAPDKVDVLPLPLIVAAWLYEGDRYTVVSSAELAYRLHRYEKNVTFNHVRTMLFECCAIGELRARALSRAASSSSYRALQGSVARLDIGMLLCLDEPPASLRQSSDVLKNIARSSGAQRELLLRRLAIAHQWTEQDVLSVSRITKAADAATLEL